MRLLLCFALCSLRLSDCLDCLKCSDISLPWKSHIISKPFPPGGAILVAKVVPESCQRTDGIDAWLDIKADKEAKRMEKEEKRRDRKESLQPTLIGLIYSWQSRNSDQSGGSPGYLLTMNDETLSYE